ncbi:MAG: response regulator [Alsobacter sp.]
MRPTLLLIDDDPLTREMIEAVLASAGFAVDTVADAFAGLAALKAKSFAAVLVDYHLPEMDGYALARVLREGQDQESRQGPVLVAITADRHGLAARRGVDAVFDAVLAKPLDTATLGQTIAALVAAGHKPAPVAAPLPARDTPPARPVAPAASPAPVREPPPADPAARFLADPRRAQARAFADSLWRRYGLPGRPKLAFLPEPDAEQAEILDPFFEPAGAARPAALGLLHGGADAPRDPALCLLPVFGFRAEMRPACDELFTVADLDSWERVARLVLTTAQRRTLLTRPEPAHGLQERLLQFLFVWDRVLVVEPGARFESLARRLGAGVDELRVAVQEASAAGLLSGLQALGAGDRRIVALTAEGAALVRAESEAGRPADALRPIREQHKVLSETFAAPEPLQAAG